MARSTAIAIFHARPECSDELGHRLGRIADAARTEQGCRTYDVHRADDDPDMWLVYAQWRTADDAARHFGHPHGGAMVDAIAPLIQGNVGISSFTERAADRLMPA